MIFHFYNIYVMKERLTGNDKIEIVAFDLSYMPEVDLTVLSECCFITI